VKPYNRVGIALVEVLAAVVIVGFAGSGLAAAFSTAALSEAGMQSREAESLSMDRVMTALTLLSTEDLQGRAGMHRVGEFLATVEPLGSGLYRISVIPPSGIARHSLETLVYRSSTARFQ
jgi:hypothetical protein